MDDVQVYTPTIVQEVAFPLEEESIGSESATNTTSSGGVYEQRETPAQPFPVSRIATELMSTALNTRSKRILAEFQFTQSGALQIGTYQNGVSGDTRITENGIVARNKSGIVTFALDNEEGDAFFAGKIQTGTVVAGIVSVGDDAIQINGLTKQLLWFADDGKCVILIGKS